MATEQTLSIDRRAPAPDLASREISGLDALELAASTETSRMSRLWAGVWPKVAAVAIVLLTWQAVVWSGWRPSYALPGPTVVIPELVRLLGDTDFWSSIATTMRRAAAGFAAATVIGLVVGVATARVKPLRVAIGSLITGLQTMPSIAWFPLSLLVFGLTEQAILFVVVLGAAPSIANGIISGIDGVPPMFHRLGTNLGAGNVAMYRDFVVPAAMPSVIAGLKQGWAFSWRSLMAGELLVIIPGVQAIGTRLNFAREFSDAEGLIATMIVILLIGLLVDAVFGSLERSVLRKRGLAHAR
jgi:NitT/TauT family transport system permease protein